MALFDVNVTGLDAMQSKMDQLMPAITREVSEELYVFANDVKEASQMVVPVDTGALMNSATVKGPNKEGDVITVTIGYGGVAVGYALKVHEDLDPHIRWKRPGSGPKYLENPLKERQEKLPQFLAQAVQRAIAGLR